MSEVFISESELLATKELVLKHEYFRRSEGITQIIPKDLSIIEIGSVHAPIKRSFQEKIERFENQLKKLPKSQKDKEETTATFLKRYLQERQSSNIHNKTQKALGGIVEIINDKQQTENNRKKHSLEVAAISKDLSSKLNLTAEESLIAEIASLCHDLGHPPFGHAGQRAMAKKLRNIGVNEYIADDNLHSLQKAKKMGLHDSILETLIYHDGKPIKEVSKKYNKSNLDEEFHKFISDAERPPSIIAQVAAISDDIANDSTDIRDIYKSSGASGSGKTIQQLKESSVLFATMHDKVKQNNKDLTEEHLIEKIIDGIRQEYISDIVGQNKQQHQNTSGITVTFSSEMQKKHDILRSSIRELFKQKSFTKFDNVVDKSIGTIFDAFYNQSDRVINTIDSLQDSILKDKSMILMKNIRNINGNNEQQKELKSKEIVKFVYTNLTDRTCYDLAKTLRQFCREEYSYTDINR